MWRWISVWNFRVLFCTFRPAGTARFSLKFFLQKLDNRDGSILPTKEFFWGKTVKYAPRKADFARSFADIFTIGFKESQITIVSLSKIWKAEICHSEKSFAKGFYVLLLSLCLTIVCLITNLSKFISLSIEFIKINKIIKSQYCNKYNIATTRGRMY